MIDLKDVSLLDILPESIRSDPTVSAAAQAIDTELKVTTTMIRTLDIFGRVDEWTDAETDELAWQYHVDYYDPDLPLDQKRQLVANAIPFHRRKGTPSAVEDLIAILFGDGIVEEWWEYGGEPYHFQVQTNNADVTTIRAQEFIDAVESVKRLTAVLDRVTISQAEEMPLYFGGVIHIGEYLTI